MPMFGVFLCVQAFAHAHPHVFVLIQNYVYVSLNGITTLEENIVNPAVETYRNKFKIKRFCVPFITVKKT